MSLDIYLFDKDNTDIEDAPEIMWMNWLRNPFGLCNWAQDNVSHVLGTEFDKSFYLGDFPHLKDLESGKTESNLHYVINHWNYDKSDEVDRKLFKDVVDEYWKIIEKFERGYFFFDLSSYVQFVEPNKSSFPLRDSPFDNRTYIESIFYDKRIRMAIPMEYFKPACFNLGECGLEDYKKWFKKLVEFAELLQNPQYKFYCSN